MPLVFPMALSACKKKAALLTLAGATMGTTFSIRAVDPTGAVTQDEMQVAVTRALEDVDRRMSNWRADSEISQFNAMRDGSVITMSPELAEVMNAAVQVNAASEGRFDTSMGPLIELWGFGAPGTPSMPSANEIAARKSLSGHENSLRIEADTMGKTRNDVQIYLAGIGKGYGADHVGRALETLGLVDYMVEIGGDLVAKGRNPDGVPWQIGIESPNPADRGVVSVVGLSDMGLATSGDYRNYFEVDGKRYSHLIDPSTGYPVEHATTSATVLAENAMLADAWSTAMLILGRERGLEVAAAHSVAVQFVDKDLSSAHHGFKTYESDAFKTLTS